MVSTKRFGDYFRYRRKTLGLTLREFCRLNGYDAGNISRLERGLLAPPQSAPVLDSYATALDLDRESAEWFKRLAAAENAGIPPGTLRTIPDRRERYGSLVTAPDLELWANYQDARAQLPQIIRRLIRATVNWPRRIELPAGEASQRHGWDGIVEVDRGNEYVPAGLSVWEIGVGLNPRKKAEEDLRKRTKNPQGIDPDQACFVFVTARKWNETKHETKSQWCSKQRKRTGWRDIRVHDSSDLEGWLEIAPAVDYWFAHVLGKRPKGARGIEDHWSNVTSSTEPGLDPEVFLTSREEDVNRLTDWHGGPASSLAIEAPSPADVIDFLSAHVALLPESERETIASRLIIIEDKDAWHALSTTRDPIMLVADPRLAVDAEMVSQAIRNGHHVLLCSHRFAGERTAKYKLSTPYRYDLEKSLIKSGIRESEASRIARESGGSLTVLKRRFARFGSTRQPEWSQPQEAQEMAPFLLAGGWDDSNTADQSILAKLSGRSYHSLLSIANRWLNSEDPPMMRLLTRWSLVSREDSWLLLARHFTSHQLDLFESVAVDVLTEDDPRFELPSDERWWAAVYDKTPRYSPQLRRGLSETIALLAAKSEGDVVRSPIEPTHRAGKIVRKLLGDEPDWQRWASLSSLLPTIAEACPDVFLDAVEKDLKRKQPGVVELFVEDGPPLFSSHAYAGLLWALETLAWNPSFLTRVSLILARLSGLTSTTRSENRAFGSLRQIFLPWDPQTTASVAQRIAVLEVLTQRDPEIGWRLLIGLLPAPHSVSHPTHRPAWRHWDSDGSDNTTKAEYWRQVELITERLADLAGDNVDRWAQLVDELDRFHPPAQERLLRRLREFNVGELETGARRRITDSLRKMVGKHRYHPEAQWSMPKEFIDRLEAIQRRFEPQDPVELHSWLFNAHLRFVAERGDSWEQREEKLFQRRREALSEILATERFQGILRLVEVAESSYHVGFVLGKSRLLENRPAVIPGLLDSENERRVTFVLGFVRGCFAAGGWEWVDEQPLAMWSTKLAGEFAIALEFERRTWKLVEALGEEVDKYYWGRVRGFLRDPTKEDVEFAVSMLNQHERPIQAVEVLSMALHSKCRLESSLLLDTLEVSLKSRDRSDPGNTDSNWEARHEIQELFEHLQADANVDGNRLASLEWAYLPFLDGHGAFPDALNRLLMNEPEFFARLIGLAYRSEKELTNEAVTPSEEDRAKAENAHLLLMQWENIPGTREDSTVDEQRLSDWVKEARKLCAENERLSVCDIQVGQVLAHALAESDGSWPCIAVRDVIEDAASEELVRGFEIEIHNKRGVYTKSPTEGGKEERRLAARYQEYAKASEVDWPATAAALLRVAQQYEDDARSEDERAKERMSR